MAPLPQLCQLHRESEYRGPKEHVSRETNFETAQTVNISFMRLPGLRFSTGCNCRVVIGEPSGSGCRSNLEERLLDPILPGAPAAVAKAVSLERHMRDERALNL